MRVLRFLAILLVLLAPAPVHADGDVDVAVQAAVAWLHTQQLPDGSFGSASPTADTVYVLGLLGEDPGGPAWTVGSQSAVDALEILTPGYLAITDPADKKAGEAGKVARAVAAAGGNPRAFAGMDVVGVIEDAYDAGTGRYHPSLLFRHTLAVEGLLRSGSAVPNQAIAALFAGQQSDGGWFWSFDPASSDVDSTGRVMQTLAAHAGAYEQIAFCRGLLYLIGADLATGGWGVTAGTEPANANSTALAIAGLRAIGEDPQGARFLHAGQGAVDRLLSFQEESGAFVYINQPGREGSRLMATVDALIALSQPLASAPPVCRVSYLPLLLRD